MLLASGLLAFAWIYSTVHTPNPPPFGVTAPQPTDPSTVLERPEVPLPSSTMVPVVSANPPPRQVPQPAPSAAPHPAPRAVPRSTAPARHAAPKWTAPPPRVEDDSNPYDDTTTKQPRVDDGI